MNNCLCCAKNIPASEKKFCPFCGHSLMGDGWRGIDFHWAMRHELEMPYTTFWSGLCELHRAHHSENVRLVKVMADRVKV